MIIDVSLHINHKKMNFMFSIVFLIDELDMLQKFHVRVLFSALKCKSLIFDILQTLNLFFSTALI